MTSTAKLGWYVRRLGRMSAAEIAWRAREQAIRRAWSRRQVRQGQIASGALSVAADRPFTAVLPADAAQRVPGHARDAIIADSDRLLKGEWEMLGVVRTDMKQPDWFYDPLTGRRSAPDTYAFQINQRSEEQTGNVKQVWELSRLQHLTLLATAWFLTHEEGYAQRVADQLRSWWLENPFLSGVNWTSGIEIGIRLINFAWIRRLLDSWPGAADLFEHSDLALRQVHWHQQYLAAFESRGSSANNHVIAEAAGQLAASCAFPWFTESARWRVRSAQLLERELARNTFTSGINRELASDYHGFVAELGFFAAVEADAAGTPLSAETWRLLCAMADSMAALVDERMQAPRQGDSDEGRVVLLDAPGHNRWPMLLSLGDALFGRLDWWPATLPGAGSALLGAMLGSKREIPGRPGQRPSHFKDAGITILRTARGNSPEIWCRCDGGPHGFLSIAAHAHADALSVEVRHGGVDILADPGTYCYHGEPQWRSYFRSTIAHNTVELAGRNQSIEGGPFMWLRHARAREIQVADLSWTAEHDGYVSLRPPVRHRRSVRLDPEAACLEITDVVTGDSDDMRLAFHLGPDVRAELADDCALLEWTSAGSTYAARLELAHGLRWSLHRGETVPILGWYSPGLGRRVPAVSLIGEGRCRQRTSLVTTLNFAAS
ncbi:alginate lyase family protein [Trebonia kvetii]|uniref:alginate lyase family protein n=1 Tax=Trebonia kvetii TaxID=2480626 RepID=UPI001C9E8137|nr:alginate lyase family protein [Trebonia kvetii]